MSDAKDYRDTVFLPKTDFPMKAGLPQKEPLILAKWQEARLYDALRDKRRGREKFILHDGPPYANGDMHIGHALNHILKDMVVRTQSLLGKDAPYVPGWDCHGLPIEWKVEEQYRKKKLDKDQVDPIEFRTECRAYAQHWVDTQREQLKRLGINGDWDNPYLTMDPQAEGTIVDELMKFAESGQLYRGSKPVMWSPVEKTALAEAEVEYEDITSTQIDVAFEIVSSPIPELVGSHAVIWTTTPWTIPVNQAIAYGPDIKYVAWRFEERNQPAKTLLFAADRTEHVLTRSSVGGLVEVDGAPLPADTLIWSGKGADLAGTIARHPMANTLRHSRESGNPASGGEGSGTPDQVRGDGMSDADWERALAFFEKPRPFLPGDFVTTDSGTGLVHMAPDHGEDDFDLCKANGIEPVFAVEGDGKYRADWAWLGGQGSVINPKFNAPDGPICEDLRAAGGLLAALADYKHSYPHSWRSKAKVIYRCTPQWFVSMDRPLDNNRSAEPVEARIDNEHRPSTSSGLRTLRETALQAISETRWVPEKGENRIRSMVEGRPDWVLSRQRAWGVPITLFVNRKSGQYLVDTAVNARIIAAVKAGGVDAWSDARAQEYLGDQYNLADYERVTDILDVWFDSGCTHAFVLESGKWPDLVTGNQADLYLEGSDQHRGWFQSSLLESCGTRGRAPYKAVLTHGFTMDAKGMKMSKSLGNTINPLDLMRDSGADILRLWALSVDFTEDHRIGKEILAGVSDQYRKLRNTFRYLLGALDGFDEAERVPVAEMPELERYMLHLLADMDAKLRQAVADFDFNTYVRLLTNFANEDLSAFFFDIRKDSLYCDAAIDPKRRAYRTVLDILFHALVRYAAPVLVFTAEEVWGTRFPNAESVHLLEWPELALTRHASEGWHLAGEAIPTDPSFRWGDELVGTWRRVRMVRESVFRDIEFHRREKTVGSGLEADVAIESDAFSLRAIDGIDLPEVFIVSSVEVRPLHQMLDHYDEKQTTVTMETSRTTHHKCGRCWRHLPEVASDGTLCNRCDKVVNA